MSAETNKELVRRFFETIEEENYEALTEFCHPDFVFYPQLDTPFPGVKGLIESEKKNFDAFPGFKMPIKSILAEEDQVAVYFIFEGKHTGIPFAGVSATGKNAKFSLMILLRIKDGKIIEQRSHVDMRDIIHQLGGNA
ncbi:ester cyclase [Priestia endophytica]|uniref:Ester cyclase n=1 Tax=Priestia endophytica TaxID=135735 RepID=A0AAX1Q892_9BACI|nr:ester cyclase [Priestia endophytica]RAS75542.1 ester cyclase [Priestia endophytica]RAS91213.1 ester cyclase [Priestia endophytica]